jgi:hypothetical protein
MNENPLISSSKNNSQANISNHLNDAIFFSDQKKESKKTVSISHSLGKELQIKL